MIVPVAAASTGPAHVLQARWPLQTCTVPVQIHAPVLSGAVCAHLLQTMVKFVLFIREQISAPYHEISALAESEQLRRNSGKPGCRSAAMNRYIKFASEAQALFTAITSIFSQCRVHRIYIVLGSSLASAMEIFDVTFNDQDSSDSSRDMQFENDQNMDAIARSMLRQLISTFSEALPTTTQRSTLFLFAECDRGPHCPDGFVPKHNLVIRPRKNAVQLRVRMHNHPDFGTDDDTVDSRDCGDRLWFQSCTSIKGLRGVPLPST